MERKTLLLNSSYMPVQILHWTVAIKMRYEGTADVLVEYNEEVCSPSVTWKMPAVMRLRKQSRKQKNRPVRFSRAAVYHRDRYNCQYCGRHFAFEKLTLDHIIPRSRGGQTTFQNVCAACVPCNSAKGDKSCDEWGRWPLAKPVIPAHMPDPGPRVSAEAMPDEWKGFCAPAAE